MSPSLEMQLLPASSSSDWESTVTETSPEDQSTKDTPAA